ncbi:MAG: sigma-70 family RNA polymerase sigma factor, partial [Chitinophagaceae bacterium]
FRSWLFRISKNHTLNLLRRALREKIRLAEWERMQTADEHPLDQEQYEMAMRAIEQLPPQQQKVFVLSRIRKMKYNEIASVLQISKETVKSYLKLASSSITRFVNSNTPFWAWVQVIMIFICQN